MIVITILLSLKRKRRKSIQAIIPLLTAPIPGIFAILYSEPLICSLSLSLSLHTHTHTHTHTLTHLLYIHLVILQVSYFSVCGRALKFIQHLFIEHMYSRCLLFDRHYSRSWGTKCNVCISLGASNLVRVREKLKNNMQGGYVIMNTEWSSRIENCGTEFVCVDFSGKTSQL